MPCFLKLERWPGGGSSPTACPPWDSRNPVLFPRHTEHIAGAQVHAWQLCVAGVCGTACMELPGAGTSTGTCEPVRCQWQHPGPAVAAALVPALEQS